jgi:hypothetical protein
MANICQARPECGPKICSLEFPYLFSSSFFVLSIICALYHCLCFHFPFMLDVFWWELWYDTNGLSNPLVIVIVFPYFPYSWSFLRFLFSNIPCAFPFFFPFALLDYKYEKTVNVYLRGFGVSCFLFPLVVLPWSI